MLKRTFLPTCACLHRVNGSFVLSFSIHLRLTQETYMPKQTKRTSVQSNVAKGSIANRSQQHRSSLAVWFLRYASDSQINRDAITILWGLV